MHQVTTRLTELIAKARATTPANIVDQIQLDAKIEAWEYAAKLIREADPWTRIDPERPETMPPCNCDILLTRRNRTVIPGERDELRIYDSYTGQWEPIEDYTHWQPWPEPAPYEDHPEEVAYSQLEEPTRSLNFWILPCDICGQKFDKMECNQLCPWCGHENAPF